MQENLGVAIMSEIPIVIIDVMRSGPSTGLASKPAQGDVMQARWGTHGDHSIIALSPSSAQECYDVTIKAFDLSEKYRTPVCVMADEIIGHMREQFALRGAARTIERKQPPPDTPPGDFAPFDFKSYDDGICPMPPYGSRYITRMNGSAHDFYGYANSDMKLASEFIHHYVDKIEKNRDDIVMVESFNLDDADVAIIAYGCSVRPAMAAARIAREKGIKAGVLKLITLWPFADKEIAAILRKVKGVVVPEMNLGMIRTEIGRYNEPGIPIIGVNRVDSHIINPYQILDAIGEALCI